jgi:hypothetical protein
LQEVLTILLIVPTPIYGIKTFAKSLKWGELLQTAPFVFLKLFSPYFFVHLEHPYVALMLFRGVVVDSQNIILYTLINKKKSISVHVLHNF